MELICPVCNGLYSLQKECPCCKKQMIDMGRLEDSYSPYSPYEELDLISFLQESEDYCIHIFSCPNCNYEKEIQIPYEVH